MCVSNAQTTELCVCVFSAQTTELYVCVSNAQTTELYVYVYVQDANLVLVVRGTLHVLQQSVGISDKEVRAGHATFYIYSCTFLCALLPRLPLCLSS